MPAPLPADIQLHDGHTSEIPRTASISTNLSNSESHHVQQDSPQYSHNHSPTANAIFHSRHSSSANSESSNHSSPAPLSPHSSPPPNPRPSSSLSGPLSIGYRSKSITKHSDSLSEVARAALSSHKPLPPGTISVEDAIKMITEYPTRMLVDTFQSPFVHPRLNRDSPRGMPEPIAVALACVGMKMHAEQSGLPFVCNIFCDQREKLLKDLPSMCGKYEEITAALHAMCIYQIEGLLSENRYDSKLSPAVLHQEYLIRMTRRITKQLERDAPQFFDSPTASNMPWATWTIHESLRRVLFLLMIIHQLLGATKILDPVYFEPLFYDHISDRLLLPCHESLWKASTQAEWEEARKGLGTGEQRCLSDAVKQLNAQADGRDTLMSGISLERDDALNYFEQLSEITKLTVSVAQIKVKYL
ncbi:uncharacterized protein BDZ99DRAFT_395319 [Mytilinidion resinicola]|uniref:Transcription factor domain-containing protein n=1 Tax=Mytilinidion resinicola TaxID=574789 RepID=A0A6A6YE71_9PEZI|nr:uncharacterized protein BDZ99DRAFT_395319 [Mytilinidion resinicola]KAF2806147.1 hypothetical protein BDZ99DRAFT_395319 [Mytilinidion resinicola]